MQHHMRGQIAGLLIYGAMALGALLVIHGVDVSRQKIGADKQKQHDAPVMSLCDTLPQPTGIFSGKLKPEDCAKTLRAGLDAIPANAELKKDNAQLQKDLTTLDGERQLCSKEVEKLSRQGRRLEDARNARKPKDEQRVAEIDLDKQELIAALGLGDKGGTCEQQLARSTAILNKIRDRRLRDFPPTSPTGTGGAGTDEVHIIIPPVKEKK